MQRGGQAVSIAEWGGEVLDGVLAVAAELDRHDDNDSYSAAVGQMRSLIDTPNETPSARIIDELKDSGSGFFRFALSMAENHRDYFATIARPDKSADAQYRQEAAASLQRQAEIEAADSINFDEYLADYFG